eukprot:sb/3467073/
MIYGKKIKLHPSDAVLAGAGSGIITRAVVSPFDVLKIRFQLHSDPIGKKHNGFYKGIIDGFSRVLREEGVRAFWKGHTSSQMLSIVYVSTQFGTFELATSKALALMAHRSEAYHKPLISFCCGGVAGMTASFLTQPLDTVRTRMVMQRQPKMYRTTFEAFNKIFKSDGLRGFYRGLLPNLCQVLPYASMQFGAYTSFVVIYDIFFPGEGTSIPSAVSFAFGALSGLLAKVSVLPLDLVKKRLQVQGFREVVSQGGLYNIPEYRGVVHCVNKMYRDEGVRGFYKGGVPSLLKVGVYTVFTQCLHSEYIVNTQ